MRLLDTLKRTIDFLKISDILHSGDIDELKTEDDEFAKYYYVIDNLKNLDKENDFKLRSKPLIVTNRNSKEIDKIVYIPEINENILEYDIFSDYYLVGVMCFCLLTGKSDATQSYKNTFKDILDKTEFKTKQDVFNLFSRCFISGEKERAARPTAKDYLMVLTPYYNQIVICEHCETENFIEDALVNNSELICQRCSCQINSDYFIMFRRLYRDESRKGIKINYLVDEKAISYYSLNDFNKKCELFTLTKKARSVFIKNSQNIKIWLKRNNDAFRRIDNDIELRNGDEIFVNGANSISSSSKSYNYILVAKYVRR